MRKSITFLFSVNFTGFFSVIFYVFMIIPIHAQDINNETNLFIPAGMKMYTDGSLINHGFFQNNGSFTLSGNWVNTLVYQGTGTISLEGTDQFINNNSQAIAHLVLNGGGAKILEGSLTITNRIDFNQGIVFVSNVDTLLLDVNCNINNGSVESYVDGALITVGSGFKVFPVGKNGKYHPVTMENITGISPVTQVEVFENLPDVQTDVPTIVKQDIYWERKTISGFFEGTPINFGYNLQSSNPSRLVILESNAIDGLFTVRDSVQFSTAIVPNSVNSVRFLAKNIFVLGESILDPPKKYYLSTTLSPNADNPDNRSVKIFGDNITPADFSFQVYNRWGLMIFETASYEKMKNQGWDGSQNGSILPSGIYPYSVKYLDINGRFGQQTGFITIIH